MKRKLAKLLIIVLAIAVPAGAFSACRTVKYENTLRIGAEALPKNLMPYDSNTGTSTVIASLLYNTILGNIGTPSEYAEQGDAFRFPDGSVYTPPDTAENPFLMTDNLLKLEGAYPKKPGARFGRTDDYTPARQERIDLLNRKGLSPDRDAGETWDTFLPTEAAENAVPSSGWLHYSFEVAEGYSWSDGTPFSAEDVKFTFDYILANQGGVGAVASFLGNYSRGEASEDGKAFDMYLGTRKTSDIKQIGTSILILPKHIWKDIKDPKSEKNLNPVGTGAYKLAENGYSESSSVTLQLREGYNPGGQFSGAPPPAYISFVLHGNTDIMLSALDKGSIDLIYENLAIDKAMQLKNNPKLYKNVKLATTSNTYTTTLLLNVHGGKFGDGDLSGKGKEFRRAVSLAVDQNALIGDVLYGYGVKVSDGLVPTGQPHALTENGAYREHKTDIDEANGILDAAGFVKSGQYRKKPDGGELKIEIFTGVHNERLAQALRTQFERIGLNFSYKQAGTDYAEVVKDVNQTKQGAYMFDAVLNTVTFAADQLLMFDARYGFYETANPTPRLYNYSGLDDAALRALMRSMEIEKDTVKQFEKAKEVQTYLAGLYVEIPLYSAKHVYAYTERNFVNFVPEDTTPLFNDDTLRYITQKK
ncbi:hypothetical protein FACS1894211_01620 [Clostridia bacterium]|nr:hypothetical protein FACS1894211_01620 [Clostridia bacterium]